MNNLNLKQLETFVTVAEKEALQRRQMLFIWRSLQSVIIYSN